MRSDISRLLKQRGHEVTKEGLRRDILLPASDNPELIDAFETVLYNLMRRDSARKALRDWAYGNKSSDNIAFRRLESYIALCRTFGDWSNVTPEANQHRYAATFEWFVSELLRREFAARAAGFGIRLKDAEPEDEFDCIALLDEGLAFVECKTGRGDLYPEIAKFIRRDAELDAIHSFFVFDRDYTFAKGENDVPKLSTAQAAALGVQSILKVNVRGEEFFEIRVAYKAGTRFFMACTAFRGFESRIRYMIRYANGIRGGGLFSTSAPSSLFSTASIPFPDASDTSSELAQRGVPDVPPWKVCAWPCRS
jgi:hypothetical protein